MPWVQAKSLSFTARHDSGDASFAERTLDRMEELRLRLEDRFELVPGNITVVVHTNPAWLAPGPPLLPPPARAAGPVPARRARAGGPRRQALPRRLADVDRAARAQRPAHGTPRRRGGLAR